MTTEQARRIAQLEDSQRRLMEAVRLLAERCDSLEAHTARVTTSLTDLCESLHERTDRLEKRKHQRCSK